VKRQRDKAFGKPRQGVSRRQQAGATLPAVATLIVENLWEEGEILLRPSSWEARHEPPRITLQLASTDKMPTLGAKVLAKLKPHSDGSYTATLMRMLDSDSERVIGVFRQTRQGGQVEVADRRSRQDIVIEAGQTGEAEPGDLVVVETSAAARLGAKRGRIVEVLGHEDNPRAISLIAIAAKQIPTEFPAEALAEAESGEVPELGRRTDLRQVTLVTIDGEDARDFDDAVFAEADTSPDNAGGWHLIVAIADVSHYVRPGSALDREAFKRGNSVYFPDRVVPMLPEALSNGLCSLKPHEPRACLAFDLWVDRNGRLLRSKLLRGLMRSVARLTYEQVQAAHNGGADELTQPLLETVINPLYGAYDSLLKARTARGTLELDLPERKVKLGADGQVEAIVERERLDSHRLIEEFMILANVAAAEITMQAKQPSLYRVHDSPNPEKLDAVRDFIRDLDLSLPKGQVIKPAQLTNLLKQAAETPHAQLISEIILRSQAQALYSPDNIGHFGLALANYAHFTSPIRRYADLIVHRTLIRLQKLGEDGISDAEAGRLEEIGEHISITERRAAEAERDAVSRYTAAYMAAHIGNIFAGRISGVSRFGLFVKLAGNGAEGLVPISTLPDDFYIHEEQHHRLIGRRSGRTYRLADPVTVKLREANGLTGSTLFSIMESREANTPPAARSKRPADNPKDKGKRKRRRA
jgi:ribonuclease R